MTVEPAMLAGAVEICSVPLKTKLPALVMLEQVMLNPPNVREAPVLMVTVATVTP